MKVVIYQTSPVLLDVKTNLEDVINKIHLGRKNGAQLIVFPELALTGYFVGQRYHEVALRMDSKEIRELASATRGTAASTGRRRIGGTARSGATRGRSAASTPRRRRY